MEDAPEPKGAINSNPKPKKTRANLHITEETITWIRRLSKLENNGEGIGVGEFVDKLVAERVNECNTVPVMFTTEALNIIALRADARKQTIPELIRDAVQAYFEDYNVEENVPNYLTEVPDWVKELPG